MKIQQILLNYLVELRFTKVFFIMPSSEYRTANMIIQSILEAILRSEKLDSPNSEGIKKTHIIKKCGLKTKTADKYLSKLEKAGYIESTTSYWGERELILYRITAKGRLRYSWFVEINTELK